MSAETVRRGGLYADGAAAMQARTVQCRDWYKDRGAGILTRRGKRRGRNTGEGAKSRSRRGIFQRLFCFLGVAAAVLGLLGVLGAGAARMYFQIPPRLLEFARKYPEAKKFVLDYPLKKDLEVTIDLTDEVTPGEIPLFIQWDERWGYRIYGSTCMGVTGCGPTCISMLVCGLTGDLSWNPYEVAKFSEEQGYYIYGSGTSWDLMTEGARKLGLTVSEGTISADYIQSHLSAETPMIASMKPGDFTYTGHFIVLTGIDEEGNVSVNDPNSPKNSAKTWPVGTLVEQMKGLWIYAAGE